MKFFVHDLDIFKNEKVAGLAQQSLQRYDSTLSLLRYNNHIRYLTDIKKVFIAFQCTNCDRFICRSPNLNRHITCCEDKIKNIYWKSFYRLKETIFDEIKYFEIPIARDKFHITKFSVSDFESNCVKSERLKSTDTTTWVGKCEPISVSISSNLNDEPTFSCDPVSKVLVSNFIYSLETLAKKSKSETNLKILNIETAIKNKLDRNMFTLNQRGQCFFNTSFRYEDDCIEDTDDDDEENAWTQFLSMQKNQLFDLRKPCERYVNTLPVFGYNSAKYDLDLIKTYSLPIFVSEKQIEPTVIKEAKIFISVNFGNLQFLDIMNFLGGATSLDSFLKAYKTTEKKEFFHMNSLTVQIKIKELIASFPRLFFGKLRNYNALENVYKDYKYRLNTGLTQDETLKKNWICKRYHQLGQKITATCKNCGAVTTCRLSDILLGGTTKNAVRTLEAMTKMIQFYHNKGSDMLKIGFTLWNLVFICLHKLTKA